MENLTIKSIELITLISNKIKLIIITFFQLEKNHSNNEMTCATTYNVKNIFINFCSVDTEIAIINTNSI